LPKLGDPQLAATLLRLCGSACRVTHLMRGVRPDWQEEELQLFDSIVRDSFRHITGVPVAGQAATQFTLPLRLGGLGYTQAAAVSPLAFVAAEAAFLAEGAALLRVPQQLIDTDTAEAARRIVEHTP